MAGWIPNLQLCTALTETLFSIKFDCVEVSYTYIPIWDRWELFLKLKYRWFEVRELVQLDDAFHRKRFDDITDEIIEIRDNIFERFKHYYNELWC